MLPKAGSIRASPSLRTGLRRVREPETREEPFTGFPAALSVGSVD